MQSPQPTGLDRRTGSSDLFNKLHRYVDVILGHLLLDARVVASWYFGYRTYNPNYAGSNFLSEALYSHCLDCTI